jgi:hypothetical protein
VHLHPYPMHHMYNIFESIKNNSVLFILFLALRDLLRTHLLLFRLLLLHFVNERFDSA